ncbi:MAG: hypothetical protein KU37_10185 [Sulfuricurvum sp. PC08-66]|nr:MAG: hypothetical protein KU37_10185 [Sulfuricurvum sp. PC08-66]
MDLKNAILSAISEIEQTALQPKENSTTKPFSIKEKTKITAPIASHEIAKESFSEIRTQTEAASSPILQEQFLQNLRERILVLFEGFQSPNNVQLEAKIDLMLNFLEHLLAHIDSELEKLKRSR